MAKAIVLLSALCVLAIANFAVAEPEVFDVEGRVFCDTCRLGFATSLSEAIQGMNNNNKCSLTPFVFHKDNRSIGGAITSCCHVMIRR